MSFVYIQPDVQMYYLLDYDKQEEIEQKGRSAAAVKFKVREAPSPLQGPFPIHP
jgi:hypothetical protein